MDVPENRRPLIHAMGHLFRIGQAYKERLEDRRMIGRTGRKYVGNSGPYDPRSAPARGRGVIQARRDVTAWVDIHLEVEDHFLATNDEVELGDVAEVHETRDPQEAFNTYLTPALLGSSDKGIIVQ